jgi:hypothetical protein
MMKITDLSHLFKWENLHNWWLTKYFFTSLYMIFVFKFYPQFRGIQLLVVLSHRYNSRTGLGETKVESHASSETQPNQAALLLNTACMQPGSQPHQCVGRNIVQQVTWLACTAPSPPQEY